MTDEKRQQDEAVELSSELGKKWRPRRDAADGMHRTKSAKWEYFRALYLSSYDHVSEMASWSDTVAYAWAICNAMIDDAYFQNPETLATSMQGDPHGDEAKIATDVINTIHRDTDTEGNVRQAMQASLWAGFGLHWSYFHHRDHEEQIPLYELDEQTGQPLPDPSDPGRQLRKLDVTGQPAYNTRIAVDQQRVCGEYVSPWLFRGDPEGRRWDLKDFKWVTRRYRISLGDALRSPVYHEEGKRKLRAFARQRPMDNAIAAQAERSRLETDPNFIMIDMEETWSRPDRQILHFPVGADFDAGVGPWPQEFVDADETPYTLVAFNRVPENKDFTEGWWAKPDIELIADQLEELNRAFGIFMEALSLSTLKYLYIKGLISEEDWARVSSDKTREGIPVDLTKFREQLQAAGIAMSADQIDLRRLLILLPQEERAAMVKHEEGITRILNTIAEILGQGPTSRYGLAPAQTATESAGLQVAKDQRARVRANQAGRIYDSITNKMWLLLRANQQLPVDYAYVTDVDGEVWRQVTAKRVRNMNLLFRHRVGTSRARDTQGELFALKETAAIALPILGSTGQIDAQLELLQQLFRLQGIKLTTLRPAARETAIQLAMLRHRVMGDPTGQMAADPAVSHQTSEMISQLLMALLGPAGLQEAMSRLNAGGPGNPNAGAEGQGQASLPAPETRGERQFQLGAAGAGRSGVM